MQYLKIFLLIFSIPNICIANEYVIEVVVFKNLNTIKTGEIFESKVLNFEVSRLIKLRTSKDRLNNQALYESFNYQDSKSIEIEQLYSFKDELEPTDKKLQSNPNPSTWFYINETLNNLEVFKRRISRRSEYELLYSGSWIQNSPSLDDSYFVNIYNNDINLYINLYKSRYLHLDITAAMNYVVIDNKVSNNIGLIIQDLYKNTNHDNESFTDLNIRPSQDILTEITQRDDYELITNFESEYLIIEDRRIFDGETHFFDHPNFGIMISVSAIKENN